MSSHDRSKEKGGVLSTLLAILSGLAASACCIVPLLAMLAGISGLASNIAWLTPLRPYLIGVAILSLAYAWYRERQLSRSEGCSACKKERPFFRKRFVLTGFTLFVVLMIAFPFYSNALFQKGGGAEASQSKGRNEGAVMEMKVEGMTCRGCEQRIEGLEGSFEAVHRIEADHQTGVVKVVHEPERIQKDGIARKIEEEKGYEVLESKKNGKKQKR